MNPLTYDQNWRQEKLSITGREVESLIETYKQVVSNHPQSVLLACNDVRVAVSSFETSLRVVEGEFLRRPDTLEKVITYVSNSEFAPVVRVLRVIADSVSPWDGW